MTSLDKIFIFAKQTGFVFASSEIYGGFANSFDYGHLGSLLKQNIKKAWLKKFIQEQENNILFDSAILLNPQVWEASEHVSHFSDPLIENKDDNKRYRADKLINQNDYKLNISGWSFEQMQKYIIDHKLLGTRNWSSVKNFNMLFQTYQGVVEEKSKKVYLRPETAQGIFINFKNILKTARKKIPFGVGQIGKSFRNEITPGNFIFRTCEFEQMELEFFCEPGTQKKWFLYWKKYVNDFLLSLGINSKNLMLKDYLPEDLSHYSDFTTDVLFNFPWGFSELWGIASRRDFDLKKHQQFSKQNLTYLDEKNKKKYLPFVIEPSVGVERLFLAFLFNCYEEEKLNIKDTRQVLKIHPFLAPFKAAILPLNKKEHSSKAKKIYKDLMLYFEVCYEENQSIGKRYRKHDMIGTPFCITIDCQTFVDETCTIRNRDNLKQHRIFIKDIKKYLENKLLF
ncbi:Glycyl-tRNA synthetase [Candidatus Phytoplasma mali]|uniref:glycine--tRNA ligase n=1 Tax=Phytoplasma mali (strain AT) TaxID=482235 RepID=B3QZV4_PHYMT|nr:glycine--tRNA ligase [Candidatus Phytoplasma mali]CAP18491.1 Glycyl-tRNA synthetase [Candidatus Phytoplasma mali]